MKKKLIYNFLKIHNLLKNIFRVFYDVDFCRKMNELLYLTMKNYFKVMR